MGGIAPANKIAGGGGGNKPFATSLRDKPFNSTRALLAPANLRYLA
jgi:hypothetical protein